MKTQVNIKSSFELFNIALRVFICIALVTFVTGCAIFYPSAGEKKSEFLIKSFSLKGDPNKHKSIFVFLDGTANNPKSGTNVWRLYEPLSKIGDPQATGIYIEGVGNHDEKPITGGALGVGMEERILRGYEFVTQNYNRGDDIYIFGFSRGAHEARDLAGFIAYAGIPIIPNGDRNHLMMTGNDILELTKSKSDKNYLEKWISWRPDQSPLLAEEIKDKLKLEMLPAEVKFLGVWDTVPGSTFKKFGLCKEEENIKEGDRYKSDSYPAIRQIAHAVSLDEKRSKFSPILLCSAIEPKYTTLNEVWFPGAHADVGGGYGEPNELSGISYNWMISLLAENYKFNSLPKVNENAKGLAHWSIGDKPANFSSTCMDRVPPQGAEKHSSFNDRKNSSLVPIRIKGTEKLLTYPLDCSAI